MTLAQLEQRLNGQKARIGLVGGRLKLKETASAKEPIKAHIRPADWHIEITIKEGYEPVRDEQTQAYVERHELESPLETICEDVLYHECGHWELPRGSGKGCPYDEEHHDAIQEAIHEVLESKGKEGMTSYVANAFEDVLVNTNARNHTEHRGQVLFWNEQGATHSTYGKFYDAFVQLNLALWGDRSDWRILRRWSTKDRHVRGAVKDVLAAWNVKGERDLPTLTTKLYDKNQWTRFAREFTRILEPFLEEPQEHPFFGASSQPDNPDDGSAFDKKLATREGQEKTAAGRYASGKGTAAHRDEYEQLDSLYRRLARDIPVEVETFSETFTFPLAPWGKEPFDPDTHSLITRKASIGLNDEGEAALIVNRGWVEGNAPYKRNITKFPNLRVALIDTSGSMRYNTNNEHDSDGQPANVGNTSFIPWGDNSKYHYALLGYYGIESFLQRQHIAPYVDNGVVNFSTETQAATGERTRRLLLTPQWGNTVLDPEKLKQQLRGDTFLLSLSDGDIHNWEDVRERYQEVVAGCMYAHIQIGRENAFTADLEAWGIPVHYVSSGNDLTRLMVKAASDGYKAYGRHTR